MHRYSPTSVYKLKLTFYVCHIVISNRGAVVHMTSPDEIEADLAGLFPAKKVPGSGTADDDRQRVEEEVAAVDKHYLDAGIGTLGVSAKPVA